ncbi:ectonucleoside triphosphate diphosphohydrolase 5 isoform X2 [Anabrus simplex]|uniref:ectonucleoside triphosphate diphosphohydrolase 5 isoform X2 n=1 Tax=Anabrus simplex TaxID=316456 RepID=UPI0035A29AB8
MIYIPLIEENGVSWSKSSISNKQQQQQQRSRPTRSWPRIFFIFTGCVLISTLIIGSYLDVLPWKLYTHTTNALDNIANVFGLQKHVYAVVIDAGSTGSRVLAFSFHETVLGDKNLKLDNELFVEVKPGLSSFVDNPKKGAESLQELLNRAKAVIPEPEWSKTPLAMKATAGLRLLPEAKAEALLREVKNLFDASPFLTNENSVSIMDGADEGLFSWFTVNFLKDRLGGNVEETVAALDLGGGSTQITFAPTDAITLKQTKPEFLHHISAFHQNITIYTHSYLGLGLMAARKAILSVGNEKDSRVLKSECINPIISTEWTYGGVTYKVEGPKNPAYLTEKPSSTNLNIGEKRPIVRFSECQKIVKDYVSSKVDKPAELKRKEINAFSYYFDRATEYGLIDPYLGGTVEVKNFRSAAVATCAVPNTEQPFMCLDLTFISVLLEDGFGLEPGTVLNLYKKIDNHEISWAMGAAFHILQNGL